MFNFSKLTVRLFWGTLTILLCLMFLSYRMGTLGLESAPMLIQLRFLLSLVLVILALSMFRVGDCQSTSLKLLLFWAFINLFYSRNDVLGRIFDVNIYVGMSLWIFIYAFFYFFFLRIHFSDSIRDNVILRYTLLFIVLFLLNYAIVNASGFSWSFIESYFLLTMFPFISLMRNSRSRFVLYLLIALCMFLAAKRTGIIVFSISLILYFLYVSRGNFGKKMALFVSLLLIVPLCVFLVEYFFQDAWMHVVERFTSISEDGGSGRDMVYETLYRQIVDSFGSVEFFLGNGYNSVIEKSGLGYSAHNDFLEVFYDFGFLVFLLYVFFIFTQIKKVWSRYLSRDFRFAQGLSVVIFLLLSFFSHQILFTTSVICLCAFWAYIDAIIVKHRFIHG